MSKDYAHCPKCAGDLKRRRCEGRARLVCEACGFVLYENPAPAAGVIIVENGQVLWVQRRFEPRKSLWTFPAGFLEYDEHVEECAVRETMEETGLEVELIRLFGAYMATDDPRARVVLLLYLARRVGGALTPGDDAVDARFFPLADPPPIAFRAHDQALADLNASDIG